uniref:Uncharacterized protein n=1 Tax=Romanomermis culicivorax TaxID=13658 RepID=A0A915JRJ1_ROMCU
MLKAQREHPKLQRVKFDFYIESTPEASTRKIRPQCTSADTHTIILMNKHLEAASKGSGTFSHLQTDVFKVDDRTRELILRPRSDPIPNFETQCRLGGNVDFDLSHDEPGSRA